MSSEGDAEATITFNQSPLCVTLIGRNTEKKHGSLMIFGHNPGFTYLINDLSNFYIDNLPTCTICGIQFQIDSWKALPKQKGIKVFYDFPKSSNQ